jgi:hypothetical protein
MKSLRKPKGQIRIRKSNKERQDNSQMKRDNKITMVVKTIHRKHSTNSWLLGAVAKYLTIEKNVFI